MRDIQTFRASCRAARSGPLPACCRKEKDVSMAERAVNGLEEQYDRWEERIDNKRKKFPQYYYQLDNLKQQMKTVIPLLEKHDFSDDVLSQLKEIGEKGLC